MEPLNKHFFELTDYFENLIIEIKEYSYIKYEPYGPDDPIASIDPYENPQLFTQKKFGVFCNGFNPKDEPRELDSQISKFFTEYEQNTQLPLNESLRKDYNIDLIDKFESLNKNIEEKTIQIDRRTKVYYDNPHIDKSFLDSPQLTDDLKYDISNKLYSHKKKIIEIIEYLTKQKDDSKNIITSELGFDKIVWNGNVNQLVDIFFRLKDEKKIKGKFYIETSPENLANILTSIFVDKIGHSLSKASVLTILKPSKEDKRPNLDKQIEIDTSLDSHQD